MAYAVLDNRNIRSAFFKAYSAAEAGSWATSLGLKLDSTSETEIYKWLGSMPLMREWLGGRLEQGMRDEAYEIRNQIYEATLPVFVEDLWRDKTGQLRARIGELASRAVTHWEKLLSTLIEDNGKCYDGQDFFSTAHVSGDSGTLKNLLTATEIPTASVVSATAPTAAELAAILPQIVQYMYSYKDDRGEPINQNAKTFLVMIPRMFMAAMLAALHSDFLADGISNALKAQREYTFAMVANPRLTWTDKLALFRADGQMKPFILQEEKPVSTQVLGAGSDEEFLNRRHMFGIYTSRAVGYGMWQHAARVTLSTT